MNAGKIQKDGSVSIDFSHASDYVIVISEEQHTTTKSPTTNDANLTCLWCMFALAVVGIMKGVVVSKTSKVTISHKK